MAVADTSHLAYDDLRASLPRREWLVWQALGRCSTAPTAYELTEQMKQAHEAFDVNSCRPRLTALLARGCVRQLGKRRCAVTGRLAYTWGSVLAHPPATPKKVQAPMPVIEERGLF